MFKSEPKTILQFLATHFDLLKQLFDIQVKNEIILKNQINETLKEFESDVENGMVRKRDLLSKCGPCWQKSGLELTGGSKMRSTLEDRGTSPLGKRGVQFNGRLRRKKPLELQTSIEDE